MQFLSHMLDLNKKFGTRHILRGIDLDVYKGETLVILGGSGSGKTTLASLLPRFYDPTAGRVLLDGHDLRAFTKKSLQAW